MAVNFATIASTSSQPTSIIHQNFSSINTSIDASSQTSPASSGFVTPLDSSSPASPNNITHGSPACSWRANYPRQLRPPKTPIYIPAVLRVTEPPARFSRQSSSSNLAALPTPPFTPGSSFESRDESDDGTLRKMLLGEELAKAGVVRIVTDEWNDDMLEDVTGEPTRDHWKLDALSPTCDIPKCAAPFTFFSRRHHCRRCGNIFCNNHSMHTVQLDQHARFHPLGRPGQRACDLCYGDYQKWRQARKARGSMSTENSVRASLTDSIGGSGSSGSVTPRGIVQNHEDAIQEEDEDGQRQGDGGVNGSGHSNTKQKQAPVVGSVPRDWNWSTF